MLRIINSQLIKESQPFDDNEGHGPPGVINEGNYEDVLTDETEGPTYYDETGRLRYNFAPRSQDPSVNDVAYDETDGFGSLNLVYDGIDSNEIVAFRYTTRHGIDIGYRKVEPHYTFVATTTGNEVLVTYDLTPGIDESKGRIRAFIVGNIQDGVRYEGEEFSPRSEIMRGIY